MAMFRSIFLWLLLLLPALGWSAIEIHEFDTEEARQRYQKFIDELRCPKCKNQNLAGTNSEIAKDLRRELVVMIEEGRSDEEIVNFMVSRYGDFVLYRPRLKSSTAALWFAPLGFLVCGLGVVGVIIVRRRRVAADKGVDLSEEEKRRLQQLLDQRSE